MRFVSGSITRGGAGRGWGVTLKPFETENPRVQVLGLSWKAPSLRAQWQEGTVVLFTAALMFFFPLF